MRPDPWNYTSEELITCPYCGHKDRDSWETPDGECQEDQCGDCERPFDLTVIRLGRVFTSKPTATHVGTCAVCDTDVFSCDVYHRDDGAISCDYCAQEIARDEAMESEVDP